MNRHRVAAAALVTALSFGLSVSGMQEPIDSETWRPLRPLLGSWEGNKSGKMGTGTGQRVYRMVVGGQFLLCENVSRFEPQERNPKGEIHEDWVLFSYDQGRKTFVAREFFSEGYVMKYVLDRDASSAEKLVFVSEEVENGPRFEARLTYLIRGQNRFEEVFELAESGGDYEVLVRSSWERVGQGGAGGEH